MSLNAPIVPFLDERKAMACVHCGLCLGSCPTYLETGNENDSPRGRIHTMRALQEGRMDLASEPVRHLDLCLGCRACETACPSGVVYGELLEHTREHVERHHPRPWMERLLRDVLIERIFPFPERMDLALRPAQWARSMGLEPWLPRRAREMLSLLPERTDWAALPAFVPSKVLPAKGTAALLSGCVMQVLFGKTHLNTIQVLTASGWNVAVPSAQVCCGALHSHSGKLDLARENARRNIAVFEQSGADFVVINAAGCGSAMKGFGTLLDADSEWRGRAAAFSGKVRDFCELVGELTLQVPAWTGGRVTYHDACHLAHGQGIAKRPRDLVRSVAGRDFVELPEADVCCGSAGSYNLTESQMADRLQKRKVEKIVSTGALTVVTSNPGCQMQIEAGLKKLGHSPVRILHLADFLAEAMLRPQA